MQILQPQGDPAKFFARLARSTYSALLLDYDGTLAPFRENPADAAPYPGVQEIIAEIIRNGRTRVVFISGRAIADLTPLLQMNPLPELWGSHGWERRGSNGDYVCFEPSIEAAACLAHAVASAPLLAAAGGRIEHKPRSVAVHWRGLDSAIVAAVRACAHEAWTPLCRKASDVSLHEFDGGLELRIEGHSKENAVRQVLSELPANTPVAFLGDDFTDEDGFRAINACGLAALVREEIRPTAATLWLQPPQELLQFLARWRDAIGERDASSGAPPINGIHVSHGEPQ